MCYSYWDVEGEGRMGQIIKVMSCRERECLGVLFNFHDPLQSEKMGHHVPSIGHSMPCMLSLAIIDCLSLPFCFSVNDPPLSSKLCLQLTLYPRAMVFLLFISSPKSLTKLRFRFSVHTHPSQHGPVE